MAQMTGYASFEILKHTVLLFRWFLVSWHEFQQIDILKEQYMEWV